MTRIPSIEPSLPADPEVIAELRAMIEQMRPEIEALKSEKRSQLRGPRVPEQSPRIKRRRAAKAARKRNR